MARRKHNTAHAGYLRLQTHSEYVILNASQRQESLRERAPKLRLQVNCLSCFNCAQWDRKDLDTVQHAYAT